MADLVAYSKRGRDLVLVDLPARGRALIRRVPEPVQIQLHKFTKRSLRITLEGFAGLLVVGALALGLAYGRLQRGPISLSFLVPSIENAINRELDDLEVKIDDAVVQRGQGGAGVLFRLRNIRLVDSTGAVVAQAPLAAIGLSGSALLWGRIAPGSVDFIGPRLLVFYAPDDGLSLTFSRQSSPPLLETGSLRASAPEAVLPPTFAKPESALSLIGSERQIDLTRAVATAFERARDGKTASSYLTRFGVRDAVVVFDQNGTQSFWQVPDFAVDLQHRDNRSVLIGGANIASATGPWQFEFRTEQSEQNQRLTLTALVRDLVPTGLAANFPTLQALQALDLPVSAETSVDLSTSGALLGAEGRLRIDAGQLVMPWDPKYPIQLDSGELKVRYRAGDDRIEVLPSTLQWGASRVTLSGAFSPIAPLGEKKRWQFALRADDAVLVADEFGLAPLTVDDWVVEGIVTPDSGHIVFSRIEIRAGKAVVELSGEITDGPGSPAVRMQGRLSAMPMAVMMQFWPKFVAAGAREWVGKRVKAGFVAGGQIKLDLPAGLLGQLQKGADMPDGALAMALDTTGLEIHYIDGLPPIQTGDAQMRIRGRKFALDVPQGWITVPSGQRLALREGALKIDDLRRDPQDGVITFKAAAAAPAALELLDHKPLGYASAVGIKPGEIGGRMEGSFQIALPMTKTLTFDDVALRGSVQIDSVICTSGFGRAKIQGGTLNLNLTEEALHATGDVMLNGVPATLNWQRIFDAPENMQPEMRLGLTLDEASRQKLGLNVNHMVRGVVPTIVSIPQGAGKGSKIHMQADLTNAELVLSNVGWRKPAGRAATLRFDVVEGAHGGTELQDFKIVGDETAISGTVTLDAEDSPSAFHFSDFSFNMITHLEIAGEIRPSDKVWQVQASGPVYDGRQFFQSLFSAGQLADDLPDAPEIAGNLDLTANIGAMVGFFDTTAKDVSITLKKRGGFLRELNATATLSSGAPIAARLQPVPGQPRVLLAESRDAGAAFRLIGFYPRVEGGEASLQVNLDGEGRASKTGVLWAREFVILGDRVVGEVLSNASDDPMYTFREPGRRRSGERQKIVFNQLRAPFSVGGGRFILDDAYINGPMLGATLRGGVDFGKQQVELGGTYIPLYGLNSALGSIPLIGNLLVGRRGEGVLGMTFAIQGPMSDPNVLVNPMSMVAPGIFRQIFEFQGNAVGDAAAEPASRPQQARRRVPTTP